MTVSPNWTRRQALAVIGGMVLAGCGQPSSQTASTPNGTPRAVPEPSPTFEANSDWIAPTTPPSLSVRRNVLVDGLEIPWDLSFATNGDLFLSERIGRISRFSAGDLETVLAPEDAIDAESIPASTDEQPWWVQGGEGGTLGLAIHPGYPDVQVLYVYYTAAAGGVRVNRVSRFDVSADDPAATEMVLVDDIPAHQVHNGGRLTFGPDGRLWITTGTAAFDNESGTERAMDPTSLAGKICRVTANGEPAPDNPEFGEDADPRVFTYGHRNPQGLAWLPDGTPLVTEHGPNGQDEVNRLVAGANYGWPEVRSANEYQSASNTIRRPLVNTTNTLWAPSGCQFYTGDAVPSWKNRLVIGGLFSQQIIVVTLTPPGIDPPPVGDGQRFESEWLDDAYTSTAHPVLENELGRVRHLEQAPDGSLIAITSNRDGRAKEPFPRARDDVLVRLEAAG